MDSLGVLLPAVVSPQSLAELAVSLGGNWQDDTENPVFRQAVLTDGKAIAFVRGVDTQREDLRFVARSDLEEAERKCGQKIVAVLTVDHSKGERGSKLAREVIQQMIQKWGGVVWE